MQRVHVLTRGFKSPNGCAFLFPLVVHRRALADAGTTVRLFTDAAAPGLEDCDVLFVESRFYSSRWNRKGDAAVLAEIAALAERTPLAWFDISDSTGWLQPQVLPFVRRYYKSQLLRDRSAYLQPHYGNRIWADYYHRQFGVADDEPATPRVVESPSLLEKLAVSWHSGLADYSRHGPTRMALRDRIPLDALLRFPRSLTPADSARPIAMSVRMGISYPRATVSWQRRRIREILGSRVATDKLSRGAYLDEMRRCRLVVSPFGFGEITLKDFEAMLCGAALLKPDMSHMETWPDLFRTGETIVTHRWDLADLEEVVETVLEDTPSLSAVAAAAQSAYRLALDPSVGAERFCARIGAIVDEVMGLAAR